MKSLLKLASALLAIALGFALWRGTSGGSLLERPTSLLLQSLEQVPSVAEPTRDSTGSTPGNGAVANHTATAGAPRVSPAVTAMATVLYRSGVSRASETVSPASTVPSSTPATELIASSLLTETATPGLGPTATRKPSRVKPTRTPKPEPTDTPVVVLLEDKKTLARYVRPTKTPYLTPTAIEPVLIGKIAFRSDMFGRTKRVYVIDPDGSGLSLLVNPWAYDMAIERERISPDGRFHVFQAEGRNGLDLFLRPVGGGLATQLTFVGHDEAYDPAWSPDGQRIVFASNQEGDDDIFVVHLGSPEQPKPRTEKLTHDVGWESDKHPSYSPDGSQVVYYSNRTGREQIWVMNADGSSPRQLLSLDADCWEPVWFRSTRP